VGGIPARDKVSLAGALEEQAEDAFAAWRSSGDFTEQTLLRSEELIARFVRRLGAQGVRDCGQIAPHHCHGFIDAFTSDAKPPELSTRHARRTALRMFFRTLRELGVEVTDPTLDLRLPSRTSRAARPLTDSEIVLARTATRLGVAGSASLQRAVSWALAEATAITSEISCVRVRDLDSYTEPQFVQLAGTRRVNARLGELSAWGSAVVARQTHLLRERGNGPGTLLTYRGSGTAGQHTAQAASCNAISAVLSAAGLAEQRDVRPASLRNWAGRRLYDAGMPIERVAIRLGARSLDAAAEDIALQWAEDAP
jgi:nucleotide-binding universal stress UspA family protein